MRLAFTQAFLCKYKLSVRKKSGRDVFKLLFEMSCIHRNDKEQNRSVM